MVKLPVRFNPSRMLSEDVDYSAEIPVAHFGRFNEGLPDDTGLVRVELRFALDTAKRVTAKGRLKAECTMLCQRCMNTFTHSLNSEFSLTFVPDQAAADELPDDYDPVVLDEHGQIHCVDMLEDELILQMPVAPKHPHPETCEDLGYQEQTEHEPDESSTSNTGDERANPFDVLKDLVKTD